MNRFRLIPSIEQLRQRDAVQRLEARFGHDAVVSVLREETARVRARLADASENECDDTSVMGQIEERLASALRAQLSPSLQPVVNATGVIVHTNLGRAPLARSAVDHVANVSGYTNLEFDLAQGSRGSRAVHAQALIQRLTGAEDAAVVNNNAAAVLLTLAALAAGKEVIISRGELVEIGGGFRIPDVLQQSGARLREVGTTNRTRPADYAAAINDNTGLILRVNPSNFRIEGFSERPPVDAVVDIGRRFDVPIVEDLGSGNLLTPAHWPSTTAPAWNEPTVGASVSAGVSVCCFSGDKLLGGPQAGIIVGRHGYLEQIRRHPLMRALRVDKMVYAALEATLVEYATGRAAESVPVVAMVHATLESLQQRARRIMRTLEETDDLTVTLAHGESTIGGGTTPGMTIPSCLLQVQLEGHSPDRLDERLRHATPPVIGRIERDHVVLDLRTVQPREDDALVAVLGQLLGDRPSPWTDGARE